MLSQRSDLDFFHFKVEYSTQSSSISVTFQFLLPWNRGSQCLKMLQGLDWSTPNLIMIDPSFTIQTDRSTVATVIKVRMKLVFSG